VLKKYLLVEISKSGLVGDLEGKEDEAITPPRGGVIASVTESRPRLL
jgi:hypothetical protein